MAHFNTTVHTAGGALANSGIRHNLEEIPVQSAKQSERLPVKLRRISKPNTIEGIRRKRQVCMVCIDCIVRIVCIVC